MQLKTYAGKWKEPLSKMYLQWSNVLSFKNR